MKTNLFSKIKTFFQNLIVKVIPSMTKENTTTDSHGWSRIWNQEFFRIIRRGMLHGFGFMLGIFGTGLLLAVPSGVSSPWASGDKLTAAGLNALRTAIESIPNWTKNGTSAYYTDGNVGIGTSSPGAKLHVNGNLQIGSASVIYEDSTNSLTAINSYAHSFAIRNEPGTVNLLTVKSNGYVGIGTTIPGLPLHIVGNSGLPASSGSNSNGAIRIRSGVFTAGLDIGVDGGTGKSWIQAADNNASVNYPLLLNPNSGNVGIGTTTPGTKLDVSGDIKGSSLILKVDQGGANYSSKIFISSSGSCGSAASFQQIGAIAGIGALCWGGVY
ncbi:MAG: hypothetical protein H7A24_11105 [Leptospiraceae bacterium]|nr:hypothetical protein [Leptospiraceae bacterium]MCP5512421.1 hypothetical protein [Leptospiraceae bacterium]